MLESSPAKYISGCRRRRAAMVHETGILEQVRAVAAKRILFLPHVIKAMARPTPFIARSEVEAVLVRTTPETTAYKLRLRRSPHSKQKERLH